MKRVGKKLTGIVCLLFLVIVLCVPGLNTQAATIKLNKTKATVYVGKTFTLKLKGTKKNVKWKSSKKKVAAVNQKGKVTGKKAGTATIIAKVDGKSYKCTVTVKNPELSAASVTLKEGESTTIKLTGAKIKSVKSSNAAVAAVTKKGKITAKKAGSATITVTDTNKRKYVCGVTVTAEGPTKEELDALVLPAAVRLEIDNMTVENAKEATVFSKTLLWYYIKGDNDGAITYGVNYQGNLGIDEYNTIMRISDNIRYYGEWLAAIPDDKEKEIIAIAREFEKEAKQEVKYVDSAMLSEVGCACAWGTGNTDTVEEFCLDVGSRISLRFEMYYQGKLTGASDDEFLATETFTEDDLIYFGQIQELLKKMYTIGKEIGFK